MLKETDDGVLLFVKVIPKASVNAVVGPEDGRLKIKVTAVPEKGKANKEVIKLLSKLLHIPKSSMKIISGETSKIKTVQIHGVNITKAHVYNVLSDLLPREQIHIEYYPSLLCFAKKAPNGVIDFIGDTGH